ncbi:RNA-directed DNA polymerase, eukaryota, reverse transcriptase zinc-binding domain protein [Tanacetum coccineum]
MCILIVPQQNTGFILDSDMEGKNEESYKFPIAVQQSFNSLWSQDVRGDPDSGIGGHWRSSDSGMYKFILMLQALAVFRFRRALAVFIFRHAFTKNGIACIYLEGKSTSYILDSWYSLDQEYSEEEVAKTMAETMERYMSKTRADYGSGVAGLNIEDRITLNYRGHFAGTTSRSTDIHLNRVAAISHVSWREFYESEGISL